MSKTLVQLAAEYEESIKAMQECVLDIKRERIQASLEGDSDKIKKLSAKLLVVYEEIRDMKLVAETLKHYYDNSIMPDILTEAS